MGDILNRGTKLAPLWYCRYIELDGKRVQRPTGASSKSDARVVLETYEERVRRGLIGCPRHDRAAALRTMKAEAVAKAARATLTVEDLARRFLGEIADEPGYSPPRIKNLKRYRRDARTIFNRRLLPKLGSVPAAELQQRQIEKQRDLLLKEIAPESVIHALKLLSKLFNWSRRAGLIDCANPVQGIERPRAVHSLDYLSREGIGKLLAAAEDGARLGVSSWQSITLAPMVAAALYTGMRRGELAGLRWQDVNFEAGRIDIMRSYKALPKSGKPRHVGLHAELAIVLRAWQKLCPATDDSLVFPVRGDGPKSRWRMASAGHGMGLECLLERAGCHLPADGKPWHMLRHTFASQCAMSGVPLYTLQLLLGHATPLMTQRYAHLAPNHLAAEVARLSFAAAAPAGVRDLTEERRQRELATSSNVS